MKYGSLDILKLHSKKDTDPKALILASGKCLGIEINPILTELNKKYNNKHLINHIAQKNNIQVKIKSDNFSIGSNINELIKLKNLSRTNVAELIKMSGGDFVRLLNNDFLPSCRKLSRIENRLGKLKNLDICCQKNDLCLQKLNLIYRVIHRYATEVPLFIINDLLNLWKISFDVSNTLFNRRKYRIIKSINWLRCNQVASEEVKCHKLLDKNLSKIIGAFAADGNLTEDYMVRWEEEHHSNLVALSNWLSECFKNVEIQPERRGRNSYIIKFRSKIIGRYLTALLGMKSGTKKYTVRMPSILKKSNFLNRKNFALGFMCFDGSANNDGSISFSVCSKGLRDDIASIMKEDNLRIKEFVTKKKLPKTLMYGITSNNNTNPNQVKKFSSFFEPNTIKWLKMKDFELGFSSKVKNESEAFNILKLFCYKNSNIDIGKILNLCKLMRDFTVYDLARKTGNPRSTLSKYMVLLCKTNILTKIRRKKSEYSFNFNTSKWNLPSVEYHKTLKI